MLIKGFDPVEAYLCDEGLARFATEDYRAPTAGNLKNMFMHLTNFSLNKNSEKYVAPEEDFLQDGQDQGSKRLLSSLWKTLEEEGHDVGEIKEKIKETVRKALRLPDGEQATDEVVALLSSRPPHSRPPPR